MKETLSEKRTHPVCMGVAHKDKWIKEEDLKQAIKKLKEMFEERKPQEVIYKEIDKIFGKELSK